MMIGSASAPVSSVDARGALDAFVSPNDLPFLAHVLRRCLRRPIEPEALSSGACCAHAATLREVIHTASATSHILGSVLFVVEDLTLVPEMLNHGPMPADVVRRCR